MRSLDTDMSHNGFEIRHLLGKGDWPCRALTPAKAAPVIVNQSIVLGKERLFKHRSTFVAH
jgi:hypothetical protein